MPSPLWLTAVFVAAVLVSAAATALALPALRRLAGRQHVREDVPESHLQKAGTPSMGGTAMLAALYTVALAAAALTGHLTARVVLCLAASLAFALVGLADDVQKLGDRKSRGIKARYRIALEILFGGGLFVGLQWGAGADGLVSGWGTGGWWPPAAAIIAIGTMVGGSNAANLTDGLDGLLSGLTVIAGLALCAATVLTGAGDLAVLAVAVSGAAGGFLILNAKPAKVWMGDVGSLGLGAALSALAVAARLEFCFAIIAAVLVAEALSVILQVVSFQSTGRRIFRMAPLHHHFELSGLQETQVVARFWAAGLVAAVVAVALLWATSGTIQ